MEEGPPAPLYREGALNNRKLRWSKAKVVSVTEKALKKRHVGFRKMSASEPLKKCRKEARDIRTEGWSLTRDKSRGNLSTA
jgi:hypothetical protein